MTDCAGGKPALVRRVTSNWECVKCFSLSINERDTEVIVGQATGSVDLPDRNQCRQTPRTECLGAPERAPQRSHLQ